MTAPTSVLFSLRSLALLLTVAGSLSCATSRFHRHLDAREWQAAANAFVADSTLRRDPRALYRAALLHASPASPVRDLRRADALLDTLLVRHPQSAEALMAEDLRAMIGELAVAEARILALETIRERIAAERTALLTERDSLRSELRRADSDQAYLRRTIAALDSALRDRDSQFSQLQRELDRLKAIDLRPPHTTTPPPR